VRTKYALVILLSASLLASSCATVRDVPLPLVIDATHLPDVHVGDRVVVTRKNGTTESFRITAIQSEALLGRTVRVSYSDISSIEVRRVSIWRTSGVVVGVLVAAAGAVVYALIRADRHSD
jgi:hypothetical protein